jgi:glutamine synthetase
MSEATVGSLQERGVRAVRLLYTDLHGIARGKDIPVGSFDRLAEEGVAFCSAVMATDLRHTPVVGGEEGYVDFSVRPDLGTLRVVPWQPDLAWCIGSALAPDGSAAPTCPRGLLARVVARYAERGLTPIVGPELEFFLLERDPAAPGGLRRYVDELSRVYTVGPVSDPRGIVLEMLYGCEQLGLGAYAANHEFMNSQYEINIEHSDALDAADRAFLLKTAVKELAARQGMVATFMGKPFNDQGGSGFHIHLSLADDGGKNGFDETNLPHGLGTMRSRFIAGVIEHGPALMALLAPTVNAYKRLVPDSLAPTHVNWGHDNRTSFVRVPHEGGSRSRIEVRAGDGSACAHLVTAGLLLAGLDGIERELEPPDPVVGDAYRADDAHAGSRLPAGLGAALDALEADAYLCEGLGAGLVEAFFAMKRFEVERFSQWVTDWELDEYARHL